MAVAQAEGLVSKPYEHLGVYERLALRYLVVELVEAAAAICVHILRRLYRVEVEGYPECFVRMGELGVIPRGLAERLAAAARLHILPVRRRCVVDIGGYTGL